MKMKDLFRSLLCSSLILAAAAPAIADERGDKALQELDKSMTAAPKQYFIFDLITKDPGKEPKKFTYKVYLKGSDSRRIEFLEPGDQRGFKVLLTGDLMYTYLPAFNKVRRVAGHVRDQGFMGTAYSYDEISIVVYAPVFEGKFISETDKTITVEATRRPGKEGAFRFPKLVFVLDKTHHQPLEIAYYNEQGEKVKTETRSQYDCRGNFCNPKLMKMVDHGRNNVESLMIRKEWIPNPQVDEDLFTVRSLQKR